MPATQIDPVRGEIEHELDMLGKYIASSEAGLASTRDSDKAKLDKHYGETEGQFHDTVMQYFAHVKAFHEEFPMVL